MQPAPASRQTANPASLETDETAPLLCAGLTVYRALKQSGFQLGHRVAIFGIGGLGHLVPRRSPCAIRAVTRNA